ncbi:glycosyl transferase family 39 [Hymenobacter roseosalivarius DSM 11622]|uniref:Glycosyl transferase family 39 n=1 Tax=Hymenobacter roseosalivarius DSM 11622 TaxID=645990 RepID=A0A1W1VQT5_9BACT|nr:glycosyltransferase family 39 protein [Hymenobacter roseosalivarius]SMB95284.1 glycosyl transferase family 39 [Hymenobacter roseosalivarius DSM 11622]
MKTTPVFDSPARWLRLPLLLLVCLFSCFVHLSAPEVSLMEARNFTAAREMAEGGSWLLPTMNGELRLAKPPLPTWAVAGVLRLTGPTDNLTLLRLPAALMATLLVVFFWKLAEELTADLTGEEAAPGRTAWLAALVLASSLLLITVGRDGQWDIFSNSFMVGALWLLVRGWLRSGAGYGWFAAGGFLVGLSILSKGPVAPYSILLPFVGCFVSPLWARRGAVRGHWRGGLVAAGVALLIGVAWPLYVLYHVAPAALAVAQTEIAAWADRHVQPFWYYWKLPVFTGLWVIVALAALAVPYARPRLTRYLPYVFVVGWLAASFVLLSLVPEKKERYMLPMLLPLALLMGGLLRYWEVVFRAPLVPRADRLWLRTWAGLLALVCVLLPAAMIFFQLPGFDLRSVRFAVAVPTLGLLGTAAFFYGFRRPAPAGLSGVSVTLLAVVLTLLLPVYPVWERRTNDPGMRRLQQVRLNPGLRGLPWYSQTEMHIKQVWQAGHAVPLLQAPLSVPRRPLVIFSLAPEAVHLPPAWLNRTQIVQIDSFYTDHTRAGGHWRVWIVRAKAARTN